MIRDWGFTLSLLIAIFDIVFVSLFFLNNSPIIPITNLNMIANSLLPDNFNTPSDLTLTGAWLYVFIFTAVVFVCGALYIRMREIK
jgi:hypothetical protein